MRCKKFGLKLNLPAANLSSQEGWKGVCCEPGVALQGRGVSYISAWASVDAGSQRSCFTLRVPESCLAVQKSPN